MTEESKLIRNDSSLGKYQFFKDGKSIMELEQSRRSCWVDVSGKTYWPPSALPSATNIPQDKQESSAKFREPGTNSTTMNSHSSTYNGISTKQSVPRPVSSYSIASLLGHNNNIKNDPGAFSNIGAPVQLHQPPHKSSPSYNPNHSIKIPRRNATPSNLQNNFNWSPSKTSPSNYGRNYPDVSPSPEQTYARYRPYSIRNPASSAPFHSYVSSQGSPSSQYSSERSLMFSNISTSSPSQQFTSTKSVQESSSTSPYSTPRYSGPSPQHSCKSSMYSALTNSSSTNSSKFVPSTRIETELSHNIQSIIDGDSSSRTVMAKNAGPQQLNGSHVPLVNTETKTNKIVCKPKSTGKSRKKKDSDRSGMKPSVASAGSASSQKIITKNNSSELSTSQRAYQLKMKELLPRGSYIPPRPPTPPPVYYNPLEVARFYCYWMYCATTPPTGQMPQNPPMTTNGSLGYVPDNNHYVPNNNQPISMSHSSY